MQKILNALFEAMQQLENSIQAKNLNKTKNFLYRKTYTLGKLIALRNYTEEQANNFIQGIYFALLTETEKSLMDYSTFLTLSLEHSYIGN